MKIPKSKKSPAFKRSGSGKFEAYLREKELPASLAGVNLKDLHLDKEDIRLGYETAVNLRIARSEELWSQFNGIMTANTILLAAIGFSVAVDLKVAFARVGLFLTFVWFILHERGVQYIKYYTVSGRELEYFLDVVKILIRRDEFKRGDVKQGAYLVELPEDDQRLSYPGNIMTVTNAARILILVFAGLYLYLIYFFGK